MQQTTDSPVRNSEIFNRLMKAIGCPARAGIGVESRQSLLDLQTWLDKNEFGLVQGVLEYRLRIRRRGMPT